MSYYKTIDPIAMAEAKKWIESFATHRNAAIALSAVIGASKDKFYNHRGQLVGFVFEDGVNVPDHFKKIQGSNAWWPRRGNPMGLAIGQMIKDLPKILSTENLNKAVNFIPQAFFGRNGMTLVEHPHYVLTDEALFFMIPDEIDQYKAPNHVTEIVGSEFKTATEKASKE